MRDGTSPHFIIINHLNFNFMLFIISSVKTVEKLDKKTKKTKVFYFYSSVLSSETPSSDTLYSVGDTVLTDKSFYEGKTYTKVAGLSPFQLKLT